MSTKREQLLKSPQTPDLSRRNSLPEYQQFSHLAGQPIRVSDAERIFNVPQPTLWFWAQRGFIRKLGFIRRKDHRGRDAIMDHQDVAYCAWVYNSMNTGRVRGKRFFNPDGTPWTPRPPRRSAGQPRRNRQTTRSTAASQYNDGGTTPEGNRADQA